VIRSAVLVGAIVAVAGPPVASAERRPFAFTFDHATQPLHTLDVAFDTASRHLDAAPNQIEGRVSIDYGITERVDVSVQHAIAQTAGESLGFAETRLRVRRRFGERGEYPVDAAMHGAIAKPFGEAAIAVAPAIVLGRDLGGDRATLDANAGAEIVFASVDAADGSGKQIETTWRPVWAVGACANLSPKLKLGGETWGRATDSFDDVEAWAGPAASWAPSVKLWINATFGVSLVDGTDDMVFRLIAGVAL
jgi:hypothetical protein